MDTSLDKILKAYKLARREDLIPLLQEIQIAEGYLSEEAIVKVGGLLNLSTTKIYGLATFYDQFRFKPEGRCVVRLCYGTACYLAGAKTVKSLLEEELGTVEGETSRDGLFSLHLVSCIGACSDKPVLRFNDDFHEFTDRIQLKKLIAAYREKMEEEGE